MHGDGATIDFDSPERAVTPGQWVVLYDGDVCLGGGPIDEVAPLKALPKILPISSQTAHCTALKRQRRY